MKHNIVKSCLVVLLLIVMTAVLSACGGDSGEGSSNSDNSTSGTASGTDKKDDSRLVKSEKADFELSLDGKPDAQKLYASVTYTPEMFYGSYFVNGYRKADSSLIDYKGTAVTEFRNGMKYDHNKVMNRECSETSGLSMLPLEIKSGYNSLPYEWCSPLRKTTDLDWMSFTVLMEDTDGYREIWGAVTVDGKQLRFRPIVEGDRDEEQGRVWFTLADYEYVYDFEFKDTKLTLSREGISVNYNSDGPEAGKTFSVEGTLAAGSEGIEDVTFINAYKHASGGGEWVTLSNKAEKKSPYNKAIAYFGEDGILSLAWKDADDVLHTGHYLYFFGKKDGMVLYDGEKTYFYCNSMYKQVKESLGDNISAEEEEKLEKEDSLEKVEEAIAKRTALIDDLAAAFAAAGIETGFDRESGKLVIDSGLLYGYNEDSISDEGKAFLNNFLGVYAAVIVKEDYTGFVSSVNIEGHSDSVGELEYNLDLSLRRAESVRAFCESEECTMETGVKQKFTGLIKTEGLADKELVYNADGTPNDAASRRVTITFKISLN